MALDRDGKGVDKLEFVIGMLINLGVQLCGKPLSWDDVRPFMLQFERFDVSQTGHLDSKDLEKYIKHAEKEAVQKQSAAIRRRRAGPLIVAL